MANRRKIQIKMLVLPTKIRYNQNKNTYVSETSLIVGFLCNGQGIRKIIFSFEDSTLTHFGGMTLFSGFVESWTSKGYCKDIPVGSEEALFIIRSNSCKV